MKSLIIPLFLVASASTPSLANVEFRYQADNQALSVKGNVCKYGRSSKSSLPKEALKQIHNFIQQQELSFIKQIKDVKQGMAGHRLDIAKLSLFYNLPTEKLKMDYYFEGNDSCVNYSADLLLNFEQSFETAVNLNAPQKYSFVAESNNQKQILAQLQDQYSELDIEVLDSPALTQVEPNGDKWALFTFDYLLYQQNQQALQSSFYLDAKGIHKQALTEYLASYGFKLSDTKENAYWQISVNQKSLHNFSISYQDNNGQKQTINSQADMLASISADSEKEQLDLIKLHLELIELVALLK